MARGERGAHNGAWFDVRRNGFRTIRSLWHFALYVSVLVLEAANNWGHTTHVKREARRNVYRAANWATGGLLRKALG